MSRQHITRVPARDVITGQVLMGQMFSHGGVEVLVHTAAEWLAVGNGRSYSTWPRFSIPDQETSGRPPIKLINTPVFL